MVIGGRVVLTLGFVLVMLGEVSMFDVITFSFVVIDGISDLIPFCATFAESSYFNICTHTR